MVVVGQRHEDVAVVFQKRRNLVDAGLELLGHLLQAGDGLLDVGVLEQGDDVLEAGDVLAVVAVDLLDQGQGEPGHVAGKLLVLFLGQLEVVVVVHRDAKVAQGAAQAVDVVAGEGGRGCR